MRAKLGVETLPSNSSPIVPPSTSPSPSTPVPLTCLLGEGLTDLPVRGGIFSMSCVRLPALSHVRSCSGSLLGIPKMHSLGESLLHP